MSNVVEEFWLRIIQASCNNNFKKLRCLVKNGAELETVDSSNKILCAEHCSVGSTLMIPTSGTHVCHFLAKQLHVQNQSIL